MIHTGHYLLSPATHESKTPVKTRRSFEVDQTTFKNNFAKERGFLNIIGTYSESTTDALRSYGTHRTP